MVDYRGRRPGFWFLLFLLVACGNETTRLPQLSPLTGVVLSHPESLQVASSHGFFHVYPDGVAETRSSLSFQNLSPMPHDPQGLLAGIATPVGGELWQSRDGGRHWQRVSSGVGDVGDFSLIAISPSNPRVIHACRAGKLQVSHDEGRTWETTGPVPPGLRQLAVHPDNEMILHAATGQGLRMSLDGGVTWRLVEPAWHDATMVRVGWDRRLYVYVQGHGLLVKGGDDTAWTVLSNRFGDYAPLVLEQDRQNLERLAVITRGDRVMESRDGGYTWRWFGPAPEGRRAGE